MSVRGQSRQGSTPHRSFGADDSALDDTNDTPSRLSMRRALGRISGSFGNSIRRPSFARRRSREVDSEGVPITKERPPIPSVVQPGDPYVTPLPTLPMIVLSICMLGEFLSANVSTPFLLFMVKGFGKLTEEAEVAFWTGILVATFFLTQFLTSLLWATVADKHGRRLVLVISLLGSALTCATFGTSTSLPQAICIRLLQGIFAGAVGVARGSVAFITDPSNEGRAYAILGFCWGFGGVAGAIIGGTFERPAVKWPEVFSKVPLFVEYPYLLPCVIAAFIMLSGAILACFLGPDGGPREGAIRLLPEKDDLHPPIREEDEEESVPPTPVFESTEPHGLTGSIRKKVSQKLSGYFRRGSISQQPSSPPLSPITQPAVPLSITPRADRTRTFSRTSRFGGSAYGYGSTRNRLASGASVASRFRRGSLASQRRGSHVEGVRDSADPSDLNFAQRLLMANENAVTGIADFWVAAAMNVDNEDPFESDTEMGSDDESLDLGDVPDVEATADARPYSDSVPTTSPRRGGQEVHRQSIGASPLANRQSLSIPKRTQPQLTSPRRPSGMASRPPNIRQGSSYSQTSEGGTPMSRRFSANPPAIFAHTGVKTPTAVLEAQQLLLRSTDLGSPADEDTQPNLATIAESRRASQVESSLDSELVDEVPPSLISQIPILVIMQYGFLALHSTTHDQIFMSYLVTDYNSGGLNLNAGHFAQLIALMCLAQIAYQFYLYPNLGPPRGRFSHLTMFRLGCLLFIPSYLTVVLYRVPFASEEEDGNFMLMTALAVSTAVRYCAITFGYTAISILLNYMTPPHAVGIANGIAQSIVSLARCFGPVLGGWLWSVGIEGNPNGYSLGFVICAGFCALCILHSFTIR